LVVVLLEAQIPQESLVVVAEPVDLELAQDCLLPLEQLTPSRLVLEVLVVLLLGQTVEAVEILCFPLSHQPVAAVVEVAAQMA